MRGALLLSAWLAPADVLAQLPGPVGPKVDFQAKAKQKTCDITKYGAKADGKTDVGPAIMKAWRDCSNGGLVYIPPGTYAQKSDVVLKNGKSSAVQLDGVIERHYEGDYHMILVRGCEDFEFFSGNSKGAILGYGYQYLKDGKYGIRLVRFQNVRDFSVHGFAAIDFPSYYFVFDTVENGEIYNMIARGVVELGMTDGFDIWGKNIWAHDIEVTNGDECVTVKSPARNFLIENIYCNLSGGTAIGSLGRDTDVKDIHYRNLYMNEADACYLKTNGGDGSVSNVLWEKVIVHRGPYPLAVNAAWGPNRGSTGVQVSNLTFRDWHGEAIDPKRPVIRFDCDPNMPCHGVTLDNVNLWADNGDEVVWSCQHAYGSGACLRQAGSAKNRLRYQVAATVTEKPNHVAPTMPADFKKPPPSDAPFTIPPVPTTFYPGATPVSTLLNLKGSGGQNRRRCGGQK